MTLLKAQIRAGIIGEVGQKAGDAVEAAKREIASYDGAMSALSAASRALGLLHEHVERDVNEGKLSLEQAKVAKEWIEKCGGVVRNLLATAETQAHVARGKLQQAEAFSGHLEKLAKVELGHVEALEVAARAQEEIPSPDREHERVPGKHPGPGVAAQRKAQGKGTPKKRKG